MPLAPSELTLENGAGSWHTRALKGAWRNGSAVDF